jgi:phosphoribosyl 1,2-cyclic phosphodiesterase
MQTFALQSGSAGNSVYVETHGVRLLFDAGVCGRHVKRSLADAGRRVYDVNAIIISHDHSDHVRHAGALQRLFKLPIYCTEPTFRAVRRYWGKVDDVRFFRAGDSIPFENGVCVHTIPTPHDATDGVCFEVESPAGRLGIFTDLGQPFLQLQAALQRVDAAYLESNYDPQMLREGPYPEWLQQRIRGGRGHISNHEAAHLLKCRERPLKWVVLSHLSEHNNHPEVALRTHREILGEDYPLIVAPRYMATPMLSL